MIKELTHREHDARIGAFFMARGEPAMLEERAPAAVVAVAPAPAAQPAPVAVPVAPAAVAVLAAAPPPAAAAPQAPAAARPKMTPKPVVVVQPAVLKRSPVQVSNPADGVVVRRNVVINVGAGQPPVKGTINPAATPPPQVPPTRPRAGAHYAVRDGSGYVAGNRVRTSGADGQSQPLASSREIRMPWETPAPQRIAHPITASQPAEAAVAAAGGKIRMPWDPPAAGGAEAFSGELVSDKSLDEVILEYLADDGEGEER
jgi:hypothetical protein